jgi:hypothetical protein
MTLWDESNCLIINHRAMSYLEISYKGQYEEVPFDMKKHNWEITLAVDPYLVPSAFFWSFFLFCFTFQPCLLTIAGIIICTKKTKAILNKNS